MARKRQGPYIPPERISIEYGGATYTGEYRVERGIVSVSAGIGGTKTAAVGNSTAEGIARILLHEIVKQETGRK